MAHIRNERSNPLPARYRQDPVTTTHTNRRDPRELLYDGHVADYSHQIEQLLRNLQNEVAEIKALHQKEISEMKSLHAKEIIQIKAAIKASHSELKAASEVIYSELQASYSSTATKSKDEFQRNTSGAQNIAAPSSQPSLAISDGSTAGYRLNLNRPLDCDESPPPFGEVLGPPPGKTELNVNARLQNLEKIITPLGAQVVVAEDSSRFLNFSAAVGGSDGDEMQDLSEDIYSLLFVSDRFSATFFITIIMTSGQFFISSLIIFDVLHKHGQPFDVANNNPYHLPAKVSWQVACAQFASLIIAFVTQKEVISCAKMMLVGYDPDVTKSSPGATYPKFLLSNFLRFLSGLASIFVSVLIVIQSNEVLEIFMNFAAVAFISDLDNIAFETAKDGLLGPRLKAATGRVEETKMKVQKTDYVWLVNILFVLLFIPFLVGMTLVRLRQSNGFVLATTSCKVLNVQFGEEQFEIPTGVNFTYVGEGVDKTFPNSTRTLPLLNEIPPLLLYQYFSGRYVAEKQKETKNERLVEFEARPVYWERGFKDPTSGKFYYCDKIKSWVFTIEAIYNTPGAMPRDAVDECEWGWLMQSPATEAITLDEAPADDWKVWTGKVVDLKDSTTFSIRCTDCNRNDDCGLDNGMCNQYSGKCECNEGWQGVSCNIPDPYCPNLGWINYGKSAYDYSENRDYIILSDEAGKPLEFYDRPVYAMFGDRVQIIMYTGRRWFDTSWSSRDLKKVGNDFHGYWDNILDFSTKWYSEPTDSILPTGLEWNEIQPSKSRGTGQFQYSSKLNAKFECLHVDCAGRPSVCGEKGKCVEGIEEFLSPFSETGYTAARVFEETKRYNCECVEDFGGFYCERDPTGPYAAELYTEYSTDKTFLVDNNQDLTYLKFFGVETEGNIFRDGEVR